jgi:transketolase C-terminal domain/subunit
MTSNQRFPDRSAPRTVRSCAALTFTYILISIATMFPIATPFIPPAQAEIPPGSYDKLRIGAEEALIIKVVTVNRMLSGNREFTLISVKAKVVAVQRSKKGIKPGTEISIVVDPHVGIKCIALEDHGNVAGLGGQVVD